MLNVHLALTQAACFLHTVAITFCSFAVLFAGLLAHLFIPSSSFFHFLVCSTLSLYSFFLVLFSPFLSFIPLLTFFIHLFSFRHRSEFN